jgi:hypothetical protein
MHFPPQSLQTDVQGAFPCPGDPPPKRQGILSSLSTRCGCDFKILAFNFFYIHTWEIPKELFSGAACDTATELGNRAMVFAIVKHAALITRQRTCLYSTDTYGDYAMTG